MAVANCREDHKFECIHNFHLCHFRYFVVGLIGLEVGDEEKRLAIRGKNILSISAMDIHWCAVYGT